MRRCWKLWRAAPTFSSSSKIYGVAQPCWSALGTAGMATKSGSGAEWKEWAEGKLKESKPRPSNPVEDFERYVLGNTGNEDDDDETGFQDLRQSLTPAQAARDDDFLEELTMIEKQGSSFPDASVGSTDRGDIMLKRGYEDDKVPFDDEIDPENDESLLDGEDAVFWSEELQKYITPQGLLNLPGLGGREDSNKPSQLRPDRTYFPGQIIEPEDFDVTRTPSSEVMDNSLRAKKVMGKNGVLYAADFRNIKFLSQFLSETSRILPRRTTSVTWKCQRKIAREIKTARWLGLIPFTSMGDPPFRYAKNKIAKDIDPEDEYRDELEDEEGGGRFRRRIY